MNTLKISDIFENFSFYQHNYQTILSQADQYQTRIVDAQLNIWPFSSKQLYLGDLLQLWFSQKWLVNQLCCLSTQQQFSNLLAPLVQRNDLYLYHLEGNAVLGKAVAQVWSVSEQRSIEVILESSLQYYFTYKSVA